MSSLARVVVSMCLAASAALVAAGPARAQTTADLEARDELIAAQESLLNTYRCQFDIDTRLVPGGCQQTADAEQPANTTMAISAGFDHSCGIRPDGTAQCWGDNESGQADAPAGQFTAISTGRGHSCGIRTDSTIRCWGHNGFGQASAPAGSFTAISAGSWHTCGIRPDSTAQCWGRNSDGRADAPAGKFATGS